MRITIDTKEDSREEIRNIIKMLSSLVGETAQANRNVFENPDSGDSEDGTGNLFSMFNSNANDDQDKEIRIEPKEDQTREDKLDLGIPQLEEYED